jgi:hypothetical protein
MKRKQVHGKKTPPTRHRTKARDPITEQAVKKDVERYPLALMRIDPPVLTRSDPRR